MCWCRPEIRTPKCDRPLCHPPGNYIFAVVKTATAEHFVAPIICTYESWVSNVRANGGLYVPHDASALAIFVPWHAIERITFHKS
jgi:hypothetical protein